MLIGERVRAFADHSFVFGQLLGEQKWIAPIEAGESRLIFLLAIK